MSGIRLAVPNSAQKGESVEVKALLQHDMESGYRRGSRGQLIPRDIITRFECSYNGERVFAADFGPGIAANPYISFYIRAVESGPLVFTWTDQDGETCQDSKRLEVI